MRITPAVLPVKNPVVADNWSGFFAAGAFTNKVTYPDGKPPKWVKVTKGIYPSYWEEVEVGPGAGPGALPKVRGKRDC